MTAATVVAGIIGHDQLPEIEAFVPAMAVMTSMASFLTAFLLGSQFLANGRPGLVAAAAAYATTSVLVLCYLVAFPGVFLEAGIGLQTAAWLWTIWHSAFPTIVLVWLIVDLTRQASPVPTANRPRYILRWLAGALIPAILLAAAAFVWKDSLPPQVDAGGHFLPFIRFVIVPSMGLLTLTTTVMTFWHRRTMTVVRTWLGVAIFADFLDIVLAGLSSGRYTLNWYVGKTDSLIAATVVLIALLGEITAKYRAAESSTVDDLTGIANRKAGLAYLKWLLDFGKRRQTAIAVLMIDVDHFKAYNDCYGHPEGDACLRKIAAAMSAQARATDLIARYGGEEFMAVLPGAPLESAELVAERMRVAVEDLRIEHRGAPGGVVTISAGVAQMSSGDTTADTLLDLADKALYAAKGAGRNRVTSVVVRSSKVAS